MSKIYLLKRDGWGDVHDVTIGVEDRRCHTYVVGKTGSGKSTLLRNLLAQEINLNKGVGLIDAHGDLALEILNMIPPWRIDDVVYFNPADVDFPCGLNILRNGRAPHLIASSIVGAFRNIWKDSWGPRLEYILYASVCALSQCENVSLLGIPRLLTDPAYRRWVIRQVDDPVVCTFWLREFETYDKNFRNEVISPVLNKVGQFLMSPIVRNIVGQVKNRIDFGQILDRQQIFLANLSKGCIGHEKASLLGSVLVSQFELAAMSREREPLSGCKDFSLCIDEFHNFITESFCTILSESRKFGLHVTLSHQYTNQLKPEIQEAVFGNVGTMIAFQVGHGDAEILGKEFGGIAPTQLSGLSKFEVAAKLFKDGNIGEPFLGKSLPPVGASYRCANKIIARSRERFCANRRNVEESISRWLKARDE